MTAPPGTLAIDLDGTLIPANSLHMLMRRMLRASVKDACTVVCAALPRLLGLASHGWMKRRIMMRALRRPEVYGEPYARTLEGLVRPEILVRAGQWRRDGGKVLLATGAPALYAESLAIRLGFDGCVASTPQRECRGEVKATLVGEWCEARKSPLMLVLTDDPVDDAPLIAVSPGYEIIEVI